MAKDYKDLTQELSNYIGELHKKAPDVMKGFGQLSQAATKAGALDVKVKELIALAIAVSTRCDGCIGFHTKKLVSLGVTEEEFVETLGMAVYMGGGPSLMYAAEALKAYSQFAG